MSKPITLFHHATGPNPWKVQIILEELGIPYEQKWMDFGDLKKPIYEQHNPNGRVPTITDPNTGITIWESGAIIQYLTDQYDKDGKISIKSFPEKYHVDQYLHYQTSGQGPYFGQAAWFSVFHPEKIPGAIERYNNEIKRVTKVLDGQLVGKTALVGDKVTYADLAFVPWFWLVGFIDQSGALQAELEKENPNWDKWIKSLNARPAVKKSFDERMAKISG